MLMKKLPLRLGFLVVPLFIVGCGESHDCPPFGPPFVPGYFTDEGAELDKLVRQSLDGDFWGAVLVEREGEMLLRAGYGYAGVQDSCTPTTIDTAYWIGSLSKQITAAAVAGLANDGALAIDDSIAEVLNNVPEDKSGITVRHLLTHSSGLPNNYVADGKSDRSAAVAAVLSQPLDAAPGEQYAYSNDGYALLAAIVEIASGRPFESYLQDELFAKLDAGPIGLNGDGGEWGQLDLAERALGASSEGSPQDWDESWGYKGATGALMTVDTLGAWFHALRSGEVIAQDAADTLFEPQAPTGREGLAYGFGWFVASDEDSGKLVLHSGDDDFIGHSSSLRWHEDDELLVIVMSNSGYVDDRAAASLVARDLAAAAGK